jgi:hypothetical protein
VLWFIQDNIMAQIQEEIIVIKLSKLVKDANAAPPLMDAISPALVNIEEIVQELVGDGVIVEIEKA